MSYLSLGVEAQSKGLDLPRFCGHLSVKQEGDQDGKVTEELTRLRRENRKLREERDILSKAAAWFANENLGTPKRSSIDPHQGVRFIRS